MKGPLPIKFFELDSGPELNIKFSFQIGFAPSGDINKTYTNAKRKTLDTKKDESKNSSKKTESVYPQPQQSQQQDDVATKFMQDVAKINAKR